MAEALVENLIKHTHRYQKAFSLYYITDITQGANNFLKRQ